MGYESFLEHKTGDVLNLKIFLKERFLWKVLVLRAEKDQTEMLKYTNKFSILLQTNLV